MPVGSCASNGEKKDLIIHLAASYSADERVPSVFAMDSSLLLLEKQASNGAPCGSEQLVDLKAKSDLPAGGDGTESKQFLLMGYF